MHATLRRSDEATTTQPQYALSSVPYSPLAVRPRSASLVSGGGGSMQMMAAQHAAQQSWWTPQGPGSVTGGGTNSGGGNGSIAGGYYSAGVAPLTPQRSISTSDQPLAQLGSGGGGGGGGGGQLQSHNEFFALPSIAGSEPPTPNQLQQQQQQQQQAQPMAGVLASASPPAPHTTNSQSSLYSSSNLYLAPNGLAPNGVPLALEGASASMRLFPSNTISTPSMPLSSYMQFQHQHAIQQQQHNQQAQQQMRYAAQQQLKSEDVEAAARRKRQRADESGASWDTLEHSNNLQPPALFDLAAAASSNEVVQQPSQQLQQQQQARTRTPIFNVQPNGTVNVNQDRIQRAIDGLHASLRVHNASMGANAPPTPTLPALSATGFGATANGAANTPTPVRGNDSTGSDDSDAGAGASPTTPAAAAATPTPTTRGGGRGAKSKAVGGARTKAAAAPAKGKAGKAGRVTSPHAPEPEGDLSDGTRKSKHRAIEKQRRDELKKNIEILSAMVGYAQTTNKNGVALAAIAFINNLQTNLDAETARNRSLSAELAGVDKRIAELQASHSAALASVAHNTLAASSASHSQALVASSQAMSAHAIQNGTVGFHQYRLLFSQYQEAQANFRELADWMRSLCQDGSNALMNSLSTMVLSGGDGIECPDDQKRKEFGQYVQRSLRKLIGPEAGSVPASPNANANPAVDGRDSPFGGFSGVALHADDSGAGLLYPNTPGSFTESGLGGGDSHMAPAGAGGVDGSSGTGGSGSSATMVDSEGKSMLFRSAHKSASHSPAAVAALSATLRRAMQNASSIDYRSLWLSPGCARMLCRDRIIIDANSVFLEDLGYTHAELIGQNVAEITPTIKQPMQNLVVSCSAHGAVSKTFLNCYRSKKGSIVFRFGQVDVVWAKAVCEPNAAYKASMMAEQAALAARQVAARENPISPQDLHSVSSGSSSSGDAIALNTAQPHQHQHLHQACDEGPSITVTPGGCSTKEQRCAECGETPIYVQSIGLPTNYADVGAHLLTSQLTALQMIDPAITGHGLNLSDFYSAGKVSYEAQQVHSNGTGMVTVKVTKQLPMKFVQAVQIYDQLARTAAATKTCPPTIRL